MPLMTDLEMDLMLAKAETETLKRAYERLEREIADMRKQLDRMVEVVRCRECEYYNEDCMSPHSGWCECLERGEYNEHFCSYGKRVERR